MLLYKCAYVLTYKYTNGASIPANLMGTESSVDVVGSDGLKAAAPPARYFYDSTISNSAAFDGSFSFSKAYGLHLAHMEVRRSRPRIWNSFNKLCGAPSFIFFYSGSWECSHTACLHICYTALLAAARPAVTRESQVIRTQSGITWDWHTLWNIHIERHMYYKHNWAHSQHSLAGDIVGPHPPTRLLSSLAHTQNTLSLSIRPHHR